MPGGVVNPSAAHSPQSPLRWTEPLPRPLLPPLPGRGARTPAAASPSVAAAPPGPAPDRRGVSRRGRPRGAARAADPLAPSAPSPSRLALSAAASSSLFPLQTSWLITALLFRSNARFVSVAPDGARRHAPFQSLDPETPSLRPLRRPLALL